MKSSTIFACVVIASVLYGQAPAQASFEVASIRPRGTPSPEEMAAGKLALRVDGGRVEIGAASLTNLIISAYRLPVNQIEGPEWMKSTWFNVLAKMPERSTPAQLPQMFQALLEERFKFVAHMATTNMSVYALTVGKSGLKVKELPPETPNSFSPRPMSDGRNFHVQIQGSPQFFARVLINYVDRPVVDMTSLTGRYDMSFEIPREEIIRADTNSPTAFDLAAPFLEAVEQLGFRLERRNLPIEVLVVDHIERTPTAN
jgi:uncharacterized protein (TIGR03435 family)